MKLANALNEKKMDVRIVDRLIAEGKVSKEEIDKYMSDLPDEAGNFERIDRPADDQSATEQ